MNKPVNSAIVIFGASGDLAARKLIPAFYHLYKNNQLSQDFLILGVSRSKFSDQEFRDKLKSFIVEQEKVDAASFDEFASRIYYQDVDTNNCDDYAKIGSRLEQLKQYHDYQDNVLYYLSTPPSLYEVIPKALAQHNLNCEDKGFKRIIVEKPFGYDLESAKHLDKSIHQYFKEEQIYRIDHYLGKETVQNLLVFRFANGMFEPLWNRNFISYVEITGAESIGVESRGGYYDGSGAMRDMLQNHLLQVLAMVTMEPPAVINATSMRDEVVKVLQSLRPLDEKNIEKKLVLGQYIASRVRGEDVLGYRQEKGVDPKSRTETYVALKLNIDNWRWDGVPFFIRSGKRLPSRVTEIVIHFNQTPHPVFKQAAPQNQLIIRIQPHEGIQISFGLKEPGAGFVAKEVSMDFTYDTLSEVHVLTAYERLLLDAMNGDATLFTRSDAVLACWEFVKPILEYKKTGKIHSYNAGSWGPDASDKLMHSINAKWRMPCKNLTNNEYCEL